MPGGLQLEAITDIVNTVRKDQRVGKIADISHDLQNYPVMTRFAKNGMQRVRQPGGRGIEWRVKTGTNSPAHGTRPYATDDVSVSNLTVVAHVPWFHGTTNWSWDVLEKPIATPATELYDWIKLREIDARGDLIKFLEEEFWGKPTDSTDDLSPLGVQYWIVAAGNDGFNGGGDPSGFAAGAANILTATVANWKNYTIRYTDVSKGDLILRMREGYDKTKFKPPVPVPGSLVREGKHGLYVPYSVLRTMETIYENQNDNLGLAMAKDDAQGLVFRGIPLEWIPQLDVSGFGINSQNPVYGINWGSFHIETLNGAWMAKSDVRPDAQNHNGFTIFLDVTCQFVCEDRRSNFVATTA